MQLLLGSEVLDLSVQDAHQDQSHLFLRHPKVFSHSKGGGVICKTYLTGDNRRLDALPELCSALIPCIYDDGIQGAMWFCRVYCNLKASC